MVNFMFTMNLTMITGLDVLDSLLWASAAISLISCLLMLYGINKIQDVCEININKPNSQKLSVVVAARNEENTLEPALKNLQKIDGNWIEFIVVNDRSTDRTFEILKKTSAIDPRFKILSIEDLPSGWLGKNHALEVGARHASHDWILFTDADVIHNKEVILKTLSYSEKQNLDFLALLIKIHSSSFWVELFVGFFACSFSTFFRPWQASNPKSKSVVGIGAFNLVRKSTYLKFGGHKPIAMRPDDDLQLAKHLKSKGAKCDVLTDIKHTSVEWYSSLMEAAKGLEKNSLAGLNYSYFVLAIAIVGTLGLFVFTPILGFTLGKPSALTAYALTALSGAMAAKKWNRPIWQVFLYPLGALFFALIILRAGWLTFVRGGIIWREHFYSLKELKNPPKPSSPSLNP